MNKLPMRINLILSLVVILTSISCRTVQVTPCTNNYDRDEVVIMAIGEFLQSNSLLKENMTFDVATYDNGNLLGVGILGTDAKLLMNSKVVVGEDYIIMPSGVYRTSDKLFYWWDDSTPFTNKLLSIYNEFDLIEYDSTGTKMVPDNYGSDDSLNGFKVYYCRCDYTKFKVIESNVALGYGKLPKLRCDDQN